MFIHYQSSFLCSAYTWHFQLTSLFSEVGLNIQEAHVFSTIDGYSLDVFVVDGWAYEVSLPFTDKFILFQGLLLLNYLVWLTCFPSAKISGNWPAHQCPSKRNSKNWGNLAYNNLILVNRLVGFPKLIVWNTLQEYSGLNQELLPPGLVNSNMKLLPEQVVDIPTDGSDVWEIDSKLLKFEYKIATGSIGDL